MVHYIRFLDENINFSEDLMKKTIKLISLAIVAMMLISLVACNRSNETVDDAADNESIILNDAINKTERLLFTAVFYVAVK
jgi:hypothetical protein